jgi:hypothetical protein
MARSPVGNGVAPWFETSDFDTTVQRIRAISPRIVNDVHVNPSAGHREIWIRNLDAYLVVFAEPYSLWSTTTQQRRAQTLITSAA